MVKRTARVAAVQIAATGVRNFGLTLFSALEPGRPSSRENAKIMREAEVTVARPHRNCEAKIARYRTITTARGIVLLSTQKKKPVPWLAASFKFRIRST